MPKLYTATHLCSAVFLLSALPILPALSQTPPAHGHVHFTVHAPSTLAAPLSGRLLIFLKPGSGEKEVNADELSPGSTWVGAREVQSLSAGASIEIDPDAEGIAFPTPFASITPETTRSRPCSTSTTPTTTVAVAHRIGLAPSSPCLTGLPARASHPPCN
jgi:hypothetical protein